MNPLKFSKEQYQEWSETITTQFQDIGKMKEAGMTNVQIAAHFKMPLNTFYRIYSRVFDEYLSEAKREYKSLHPKTPIQHPLSEV